MKRIEDIKEFEDIDTYYEISVIVSEVFKDRVEAHKHLVTANKEIERLNNIINELEKENEQLKEGINKIDEDEFDNFHAQGFDNKIYCPLCYFKKENQELYYYCSTDFERNIVLIIKKAQEQLKEKQKKIDKAISYFESEEFKESCKVLTEKLDNTGGYGYWLIVREYIDCVKERLR